jgi:hypothetical protein
MIGIKDISKPDFGEAVPIYEGEFPVFWAFGVTPQAALMASKPPFAITMLRDTCLSPIPGMKNTQCSDPVLRSLYRPGTSG